MPVSPVVAGTPVAMAPWRWAWRSRRRWLFLEAVASQEAVAFLAAASLVEASLVAVVPLAADLAAPEVAAQCVEEAFFHTLLPSSRL